MKFFVLSDVHSFYEPMMEALTKQGFELDNPQHRIIICGDLFDRGPDTVRVLEFMKKMNSLGRLEYVCGNHEELLFDCIKDLNRSGYVSSHHVHNGTVDTLAQVSGFTRYDLLAGAFDRKVFNERIQELVDFVTENAVDYVEIGDYIFCHGWIPCNPYGTVFEDWREGDWAEARWFNGMSAWHKGAKLPGKTIVCGHYHCSWGWSHLRQERKEFPHKNIKNWKASFEPFVDEGIIALDSCVAYTEFCNCWVLEI